MQLNYRVNFPHAPDKYKQLTMSQEEAIKAADDFLALKETLAHEETNELRRERRAAAAAAAIPIAPDPGEADPGADDAPDPRADDGRQLAPTGKDRAVHASCPGR